jgi:hypothetical protein
MSTLEAVQETEVRIHLGPKMLGTSAEALHADGSSRCYRKGRSDYQSLILQDVMENIPGEFVTALLHLTSDYTYVWAGFATASDGREACQAKAVIKR